jgi:hypothetical protein
MESMKVFAFLAAFVLLLTPHVNGQQMKLEIRDGRVSLDAQNVPVRQILAEWARVGGSRVINGDKIVGAPVTLQFNAVPERQALDIILRGVSGYMLAARQAGSTGVSAFDRILILPTSAGPRNNAAPATNAANPFNQPGIIGQPGMVGAQPGMMGRPMPGQPVVPGIQVEDDVSEPNAQDDDADDDLPPPVFPRPGNRAGVPRRPNVFPTPTPVPGMPPGIPPQMPPGEGGQPGQPAAVSPGNPFGIPAGSGGTPGTVTPPQQQRPPE